MDRAVEPKYALGLLAAKADRLLTNERPLLYWPLYRQSVLPDGEPRAERGSRATAPASSGWSTGSGTCWSRRRWSASSPRSRAATASRCRCCRCRWRWRRSTSLFFAEVRYHLAIVVLLLPFAGAGLVLGRRGGARSGAASPSTASAARACRIEGVVAALVIALLFVGWPRHAGGGRAAARRSTAGRPPSAPSTGAPRVCAFRATLPAPGQGASPVRGVWDGFGLRLAPPAVAAATDLDLPAGKYSVSMRVERAGVVARRAPRWRCIVGGAEIKRTPWPATGLTDRAGGRRHARRR